MLQKCAVGSAGLGSGKRYQSAATFQALDGTTSNQALLAIQTNSLQYTPIHLKP